MIRVVLALSGTLSICVIINNGFESKLILSDVACAENIWTIIKYNVQKINW